jgi:hypothetical protein
MTSAALDLTTGASAFARGRHAVSNVVDDNENGEDDRKPENGEALEQTTMTKDDAEGSTAAAREETETCAEKAAMQLATLHRKPKTGNKSEIGPINVQFAAEGCNLASQLVCTFSCFDLLHARERGRARRSL